MITPLPSRWDLLRSWAMGHFAAPSYPVAGNGGRSWAEFNVDLRSLRHCLRRCVPAEPDLPDTSVDLDHDNLSRGRFNGVLAGSTQPSDGMCPRRSLV